MMLFKNIRLTMVDTNLEIKFLMLIFKNIWIPTTKKINTIFKEKYCRK